MTQTFAQKYDLTDEEREILIQRVAERFQNYVYVEAEHWTRETINRMCDTHGLRKDDVLNLTFNVSQVVADIIVELGRCRRENQPDS